MVKIFRLFLISIFLLGCQSNIDKSTNKINPLNDQALDKFVCNNIANIDDDDFIEFMKFSLQVQNKGMNQFPKNEKIKILKIFSKALEGDNQTVKINESQAMTDFYMIESKYGPNFIPDEKGIDIILKNLPKHRAANLLRALLKLDCKSGKTYK